MPPNNLSGYDGEAGMNINPSEAQLLLVMLGQSDISRIRSGEHTAEDFLKLVGSLKRLANADENKAA